MSSLEDEEICLRDCLITLSFRQYTAGYMFANLRRYPIRRHITFASALEV